MENSKKTKHMGTTIRHSIWSIVVKHISKEVAKYDVTKYIEDYGVVMETREKVEEEVVNVEWYIDHPSHSAYSDNENQFIPAKLCWTVAEYGKHLKVEYLGLQYCLPDRWWRMGLCHALRKLLW